jgi:hypothetical protein
VDKLLPPPPPPPLYSVHFLTIVAQYNVGGGGGEGGGGGGSSSNAFCVRMSDTLKLLCLCLFTAVKLCNRKLKQDRKFTERLGRSSGIMRRVIFRNEHFFFNFLLLCRAFCSDVGTLASSSVESCLTALAVNMVTYTTEHKVQAYIRIGLLMYRTVEYR